jgi:nitric oxide reductase activation protein
MYGRAHCGENFQLLVTGNKEAYCDGVNVVLPYRLPFSSEIGEKVYRLLMAKNAGFLEFSTMEFSLDECEGTWVAPRDEELEIERLFRSFKSALLAKELFFTLENFRVEQALRQEYFGLQILFDQYGKYVEEWQGVGAANTDILRELQSFEDFLAGSFQNWTLLSEELLASCKELSNMEAGVLDSIQLLVVIFPIFYRVLVSQESKESVEKFERKNSSSVQTKKLSPRDRKIELRVEEILKERAKKGEELSRQKAKEIDFRETSEFLDRNPGVSAPKESEDDDKDSTTDFAMELSKNMEALDGEFTYPEWDIRIEDWKLNWSRVREFILPSDLGAFQKAFWGEYNQEIQRVKRVFQALRLEQEKPVKRLWDGDQIDFDRLLDASIAIRSKQEPDLRIYQRTHRQNRDIGVAFLVDMSSSTNEIVGDDAKRILDVEKQALFLIAEALHSLGDPFAIYGFSGFGREQVAFYIAKEMNEAWDEDSQAKLGAMSWKLENRDGAAIRHCTAKMKPWRQKQKLLILLSDGKPLDCGSGEYQDELAQMDTWRALQEAKQQGVRPFCITVDPHGKDYLEAMYGQGNYISISSIETLPRKLPAIYRQLTGLGN